MKITVKIAVKDDTLEEVEASTLELFPWIETIIYHSKSGNQGGWLVNERSTGHLIRSGRTRKDATENARELLAQVGEENTVKQIAVVRARLGANAPLN